MEQNFKNFLEQIDDTTPEPKYFKDFDLKKYWLELNKISENLAFEANKISLAWLSPPVPSVSDITSMGSRLEIACVALLAAFHSFPCDAGITVRSEFKVNVKGLIDSCICFAKTLTETLGKKFASNNHPILQSFGQIMTKCEAVKRLPQSNKDACTVLIKEQYSILKDALDEFEDVKNGGLEDDLGDSVEQWAKHDEQIINPSIGMIKTSIVLVKKANNAINKDGLEETADQFKEYDLILENIKKTSELVDDLALSLYPPLNWSECKNCNQLLKDHLETVLQYLGNVHFMKTEDASKWREFVGKAILHNFSEIQRVFITQGFAEIKVSE